MQKPARSKGVMKFVTLTSCGFLHNKIPSDNPAYVRIHRQKYATLRMPNYATLRIFKPFYSVYSFYH